VRAFGVLRNPEKLGYRIRYRPIIVFEVVLRDLPDLRPLYVRLGLLQLLQQHFFVGRLQLGEQFLTEVVSVLVDKKAREIIR